MIKIEKLDTENILGNPNMKYSIDFGGQKRYFTEKALLELQGKLNTFAVKNVVGQSEQCTHEKEALSKGNVSQQRELLKAYAKYHNENFDYEKIYDTMIDRFLSL